MTRLKFSLTIRFLIVALSPIVLISVLALVYLEKDNWRKLETNNALLATSVAYQVWGELQQSKTVLQDIGLFIRFHEPDDAEINSLLDKIVTLSDRLESVYIVNSQGMLKNVGLSENQLDQRDDFLGLDLSKRPDISQTLNSKIVAWSDVYLSVVSGKLAITLSIPFDNQALVANFSIENLQQIADQFHVKKDISAFLTDRNGHLLIHPDKTNVLQKQSLRNLEPIRKALANEWGASEFEVDGEFYIGSVSVVPEISWLVLIAQNTEDVFAPIQRIRKIFLFGIIIAIIVSIFLSMTLSTRLTKPLAQLGEGATAISKGEYDKHIPVQRYWELEVLASNVREMAQEIKEREKELAIIAESMIHTSGQEVFVKIVQEACRAFGTEMGLVGRMINGSSIEALYMEIEGNSIPDFKYELKGTPCQRVIEAGEYCIFPTGVKKQFPVDDDVQKMGVDGYVGAPLIGKESKPIGILNVFSKKQIKLTKHARETMNILAARAEVELQRIDAEKAKEQLEEQLKQSQKMESIGRLAGGVAHDFNNLLTSITGNVQLAQMDLPPNDPMTSVLEEINGAADRAANLTRQLLAFSRKQIIEPRIINLNSLIEKMHNLLVRIIGEDIDFKFVSNKKLWPIKADPGQVEQIIVNLAVNARDAMPDGGKLTIEMSEAVLDSDYCEKHDQLKTGKYVVLEVIDNGQGMDEKTQQNIFDPFFTTKPEGEGTGLGLATVYGIVKQHSGHIEVQSESGVGTRFKIYLPASMAAEERTVRPSILGDLPRGDEVVLVVEDEDMVRQVAEKILARLGYNVISVSSGEDAILTMKQDDVHVDILFTDVVMPKMNGKELVDQLRRDHPTLKVLFATGYTEDVIAHHGVLDEGLNFIAKPYTPHTLAIKLRQVLDAPA